MFTGIIEEVGRVTGITNHGDHARLAISATTVVDADLGDSVAVDGCCLTVAAHTDDGFEADLMAETLRATALGELVPGDRVNLERAMAADGRFGGHVVQGHVDGVGEVVTRRDEPGTTWLDVHVPREVAAHLVAKGSITMAGASLTVVDVDDHDDGTATFSVGLVPHTLAATTFDELDAGDRVNLEADVLAKYVERLVAVHLQRLDGVDADRTRTADTPTSTPGPDATATTGAST